MCKTRFDSQGMILNSIQKKKTFLKKKNVNGTRGVGMKKKTDNGKQTSW